MKLNQSSSIYRPGILIIFWIVIGVAFNWMFLGSYLHLETPRLQLYAYYLPGIILVLAYLLTNFFWVLGSRRRWIYDSICGIFMLSFILGVHLYLREQETRFIDLENEKLKDYRTELRQEIAKQNQLKIAELQEKVERSKLDRYVQYEGRIPDSELQAIKEIDKQLMSDFNRVIEDYQSVIKNEDLKSFNDWIRTNSLDELIQQRVSVIELLEVSREVVYFLEQYESRYIEQTNQLKLSEGGKRVAIAERERIFQYFEKNRILDIRKLEVGFLNEALKLLNSLTNEWGSWQYDYRDSKLVFDRDELERIIIGKLQEIMQIQKQLNLLIQENENRSPES